MYFAPLPVREAVSPCLDGYTIWIDEKLDQEHRMRAYQHALEHIKSLDFEGTNVQTIEAQRHRRKPYENRETR